MGAPPGANGTNGTNGTGAASRGGGLLEGSAPSAALTKVLEQDAGKFEWIAATVGANSAAGYQLATGLSVMPIGGFNGSDPSPTLAQFQRYVADGRIHFYISGGTGGPGGMGGPGGGSGNGSEITQWVKQHFNSKTVDGVTLYDLTSPTS